MQNKELGIEIMPKALKVIDSIANFVESKNTKGSGARYALNLKKQLKS